MRWIEQYKMKRLGVAGLCFAAVLVVGVALAGTASAATLWLLCVEGSGLTKYTNNQCTKANGEANSTHGWQSLSILPGEKDTIRISDLTLVLRDEKAGPLGENSLVTCLSGGRATGLITSPTEGVIESARLEEPGKNCKSLAGPCSTIESVNAADLPWDVTLFENGTKILTKVEKGEGAAGEPGWEVTCKTLLGSKTDKCISEPSAEEQVELKNQVSEGVLLILGTFEAAHKATCSQAEGTKETGLTHGLFAILVPGGGLSVIGIVVPIFELKNPEGPLSSKPKVGEERKIEVLNTGPVAGRPAALGVAESKVGYFETKNEENCRTKVYAVNETCILTVKVLKITGTGEAVVTWKAIVTVGNANNKITLTV